MTSVLQTVCVYTQDTDQRDTEPLAWLCEDNDLEGEEYIDVLLESGIPVDDIDGLLEERSILLDDYSEELSPEVLAQAYFSAKEENHREILFMKARELCSFGKTPEEALLSACSRYSYL